MESTMRLPDSNIMTIYEAAIEVDGRTRTTSGSNALIAVGFGVNMPLSRTGTIVTLDLDIITVLSILASKAKVTIGVQITKLISTIGSVISNLPLLVWTAMELPDGDIGTVLVDTIDKIERSFIGET